MNLFGGMSDAQIKSALLAFILFGFFATLEAGSLYAFYVTSRPRRGRVRTAALYHVVAGLLFFMSIIAMVWAAPAEKSFIDADNAANPSAFFAGERFGKVIIGLIFAVAGIFFMAVGALVARRQREALADDSMLRG